MTDQSSASVPFLWVSVQTPLFSSGFGLCFVLLLRLCLGRKLLVCAFQSGFCFSPPLCSRSLSVICPLFMPGFPPPVYAGFLFPPRCVFFSGFYKARERGNQGEPRSSMRPTICSYRSPAETVLSDEEGGAFDSEMAPFTTGNGNFHFGP